MSYSENYNQSTGPYSRSTSQSQAQLSEGQRIIAKKVQSSLNFLLDRIKNGENPTIRAEAQAAYDRLRQLDVTQYQPRDAIEAHQMAMAISQDSLGDQSRFYTNEELDSMRQDYEADLDGATERGDLYEDGGIPGMYISGYSPAGANEIIPLGGRLSTGMFFGTPMDDYRKRRLNSQSIDPLQAKYEHAIYKNDRENPYAATYPSHWDNPVVVSEFTAKPDHYDAEFNMKRAQGGDKRYQGPHHYAIVAHGSDKGGNQRLDAIDLDMAPSTAADYTRRYYFPFTGYSAKEDDGTTQAVNQFHKASIKYSPYDFRSEGEIMHRSNDRTRHLNEADSNGIFGDITPKGQRFIMSIANSDEASKRRGEIDYGGIQSIDPHTAEIRTKGFYRLGSRAADLRAQKAAERQQADIQLARGGHLRTPNTIRSRNGLKMRRADDLGSADYDIYF